MVFRLKSPRRIMEEGGSRTRSKLVLILLVVVFVVMGFYLYSYTRENKVLLMKEEGLTLKLGKYVTAYQQCERNLKSARGDVSNFHESNKALQSKVIKQDSELAGLEKNNLATESKLQDAFTFFLEVKELVGNDQTLSEQHEVTADVASPLKKDISILKESHQLLGSLQKTHKATLKKLQAAKQEKIRVEMEKKESERRLTVLALEIERYKKQVDIMNKKVVRFNATNIALSRTVQKLKNMMKKKRNKLESEKVKAPKDGKPDVPSSQIDQTAKTEKVSQITKTGKTEKVSQITKTGKKAKIPKSDSNRKSPRFAKNKVPNVMERRVVEHRDIAQPPPQPKEIKDIVKDTTQKLLHAQRVVRAVTVSKVPDNPDNTGKFGDTGWPNEPFTQEELEGGGQS